MADIIIDTPNRLWLGDMEARQDEKFLRDNNIKVIFNITTIKFKKHEQIEYYQIPLSDSDSPSSIKKFVNHINIIDIINEKLKDHNILVHCEMGMQRSAAIIAAYLIKYHKMNIDDSITHITTRRPKAFKHRVTFLEALYKVSYY